VRFTFQAFLTFPAIGGERHRFETLDPDLILAIDTLSESAETNSLDGSFDVLQEQTIV
jgi:hypothetical protein